MPLTKTTVFLYYSDNFIEDISRSIKGALEVFSSVYKWFGRAWDYFRYCFI